MNVVLPCYEIMATQFVPNGMSNELTGRKERILNLFALESVILAGIIII